MSITRVEFEPVVKGGSYNSVVRLQEAGGAFQMEAGAAFIAGIIWGESTVTNFDVSTSADAEQLSLLLELTEAKLDLIDSGKQIIFIDIRNSLGVVTPFIHGPIDVLEH